MNRSVAILSLAAGLGLSLGLTGCDARKEETAIPPEAREAAADPAKDSASTTTPVPAPVDPNSALLQVIGLIEAGEDSELQRLEAAGKVQAAATAVDLARSKLDEQAELAAATDAAKAKEAYEQAQADLDKAQADLRAYQGDATGQAAIDAYFERARLREKIALANRDMAAAAAAAATGGSANLKELGQQMAADTAALDKSLAEWKKLKR